MHFYDFLLGSITWVFHQMDLVHLDHFFVGGALTWGVSYGQGQGCDYTEKTQNPLDPATPSEVFGEIRGKFAISLVLTSTPFTIESQFRAKSNGTNRYPNTGELSAAA